MQLPAETIVRSEYGRLLEACVSAREIWKKHRAEIYRYRLVGKKNGRRTSSTASKLRSGVLRIAAPHAAMPPVPVRFTNCVSEGWAQFPQIHGETLVFSGSDAGRLYSLVPLG